MPSPPPHKRPRLSRSPSPLPIVQAKAEPTSPTILPAAEEQSEDHCAICLQEIVDRTVLPTCAHDVFCFECILIWTDQSRRCPLCTQNIGDHLIHNIRSAYDYQKHFLPPLKTELSPPAAAVQQRREVQSRRRTRQWGRRRDRESEAEDEMLRAVERRRWIYRHGLYAKHVASNIYTRYKPAPTPAQFAISPDLISRATVFLRRELLVWPNLDVEFLITFVLSLLKSLDIRSEASIKLLAEFLDLHEGGRKNAEHFAHELYSYLRSPYRALAIYDTVVQYDVPAHVTPPSLHPPAQRARRWPSPPPARSPSPRRVGKEYHRASAENTVRPYTSKRSHDDYEDRSAYHPRESRSRDPRDRIHTRPASRSPSPGLSRRPSDLEPHDPEEGRASAEEKIPTRDSKQNDTSSAVQPSAFERSSKRVVADTTSFDQQASTPEKESSTVVPKSTNVSAPIARPGPVKIDRRRLAPLAAIQAHISSNGKDSRAHTASTHSVPVVNGNDFGKGLRIKSAASQQLNVAKSPEEPTVERPTDLVAHPPIAHVGLRIKSAATKLSTGVNGPFSNPIADVSQEARVEDISPTLASSVVDQNSFKERLLSKLEDERRQLTEVSTGSTKVENSSVTGLSTEEQEARLRVQARLQLRLAAERRLAATSVAAR